MASADEYGRRRMAAPAVALRSAGAKGAANVLPRGFRLHEFVVDSTIGEGGFGIVYLAQDIQLRRQVAIKEFMPSALATRQPDYRVAVRSERYHETFDAGMRSFINEAQLLAQFDHPALLKVYRFWEENGTAYMAMPYYRGPTFKDWLRAQPGKPSEAMLRGLLGALLEPLEELHAKNVFHRDIAPDNILLLDTGGPLLLDFGAARRIIGDMTQALTVILKSGYAPIEQYAELPELRQGPWTDIHALAAVIYFGIAGRPPPPSIGRMIKDEFIPAARVGAGRYSPAFLAAIDRGLALQPADRPASIAEFRQLLPAAVGDRAPPKAAADQTTLLPPSRPAPPALRASPAPPTHRAPPLTRRPATVTRTAGRDPVPPRGLPTALIALGGFVAMLVLGGLLAWWVAGSKDDAAPSPGPLDPPSAVAPPAALRPIEAAAALQQIYARRSEAIDLAVRARPERAAIGIDQIHLSLVSSVAGYVYVLVAGTQGDLRILLPDDRRPQVHIDANAPFVVPPIPTEGPAGTDHLLLLVSVHPLRLAQSGRIDLQRLAQAHAEQGDAQCLGLYAPCNARFGAALLEVEQVPAAAPAPSGAGAAPAMTST